MQSWLQSLTPRQTLYFWAGLVVFLVLFIGIYSGKSVEVRDRYLYLNAAAERIRAAEFTVPTQRKQLSQLDQRIQSLSPTRTEIPSHNHFIQYMEGVCEQYGVRLVAIPTESIQPMGAYKVARISLSLEGGYEDILQTVFQIEQRDKLASVQSLSINVETIHRNFQKKKLLIGRVVLNRLVGS